jgi:hypothetical protein
MMLDVKHAAIYVALWRDAGGGDGAYVIWYALPDEMPAGTSRPEGGAAFSTGFDDADEPEPRIWIQRAEHPSGARGPIDPDVGGANMNELLSLAHELGHFASNARGTYVASIDGSAPAAARLAEEVGAWEHARGRLAELGFDEWAPFERLRADALASYGRQFDHETIADRLAAAAAPRLRIVPTPAALLGDRNGVFSPNESRPTVRFAKGLAGLERLATLAHELGHAESWRRGHPPAYRRAVERNGESWCGTPIDEQRAVLAEELLAWQLGLQLARLHGLVDADAFSAIARVRLSYYRDRLDVTDKEFDAALAALAQSPPAATAR